MMRPIPVGHCPTCIGRMEFKQGKSVQTVMRTDGTTGGTVWNFVGACGHEYPIQSAVWRLDEPNGRTLGAVMVVKNTLDQVLMCRRIGGQFDDKLQFIGGTVEVGENSLTAALRETKEEAGLDIKLEGLEAKFLGAFDDKKQEGVYSIHVYVCQWPLRDVAAKHTEPTKMGPWELYDDMEIHRPMPMVPRILAELQDWKKKWV